VTSVGDTIARQNTPHIVDRKALVHKPRAGKRSMVPVKFDACSDGLNQAKRLASPMQEIGASNLSRENKSVNKDVFDLDGMGGGSFILLHNPFLKKTCEEFSCDPL
jgi:hypothetical protein